MRIIAGKFKSRKLRGTKPIRPTEDKVKKSLFDILRNVVCDCRFLDLYAGCGAVGIEALSRGAREAYFVEKDFKNCAIIEENLTNLDIEERFYRVLSLDAEGAIVKLHSRAECFDLIFLDPPYHHDLAKKALQMLGAYDIVTEHGFVIVQHHRKDELPDKFTKLTLWRTKSYSTTLLSFYHKANQPLS